MSQTPDSLPLTGRRALITGASRGIGRAVALRLSALGASVLLLARDQKALAEVKDKIVDKGGAADCVCCDLRSPEAVEAIRVRVAGSGCNILVNAAGIGSLGRPLHETDPAAFDAVFATNVRAPYLLMRALVPGMMALGGGCIVNI